MDRRWTKQEAWQWWNEREWLMGINYVPSCMPGWSIWQEDTLEQALRTVIPELDLMRDIGFNSIRIRLPFEIWAHEGDKFLDRLSFILSLLDERGMGMMARIFSDCVKFGRPDDITIPCPKGYEAWDKGHHGGHADSPFIGDKVRRGWLYWDEPRYAALCEDFVYALAERFGRDRRIQIWDVWNEPGNSNRGGMSIPMMARTFEILREKDVMQPLTACVWRYPENYGRDMSVQISEIERFAIDLSDIVSFHQYSNIDDVKATIAMLEREGRPMANTEWLHRIQYNYVQDDLPLYYGKKIASYHWGLVAGNSQHYLPWDDIRGREGLDFSAWQHDIFREDGHTPYDPDEIALFRAYGAAKDRAGSDLK